MNQRNHVSSEKEQKFIREGLTKIQAKITAILEEQKNTGAQRGLVQVPAYIYHNLLSDAYRKRPLFTGRQDGTNRPIRYDKTEGIFYAADANGYLIVPADIIYETMQNNTTANKPEAIMSVFGAEVQRQMELGNFDYSLWRYDEKGNYLGAMIDGKLTSPNELAKIHINNPSHK